MDLLGKPGNSIFLVKDPFKSDKITSIRMSCFTQFSFPVWEGSIGFKNGSTEGTQRFEVQGVENLSKLLEQMQTFVNSLK